MGFTSLGFDEIVSFTVPTNVRSRAVMERLGMTPDPWHDFDHPRIATGHPLRRHVLYRLNLGITSPCHGIRVELSRSEPHPGLVGSEA
jgi:RimJ/RimL family protein N-acetyltransferase